VQQIFSNFLSSILSVSPYSISSLFSQLPATAASSYNAPFLTFFTSPQSCQ